MQNTAKCENGFVRETKSQAHVREKSALSGGSLDPRLLRWLPPVVVNDAKKVGIKETVWLKCCLPLWQESARLCAQASIARSVKSHHVW